MLHAEQLTTLGAEEALRGDMKNSCGDLVNAVVESLRRIIATLYST